MPRPKKSAEDKKVVPVGVSMSQMMPTMANPAAAYPGMMPQPVGAVGAPMGRAVDSESFLRVRDSVSCFLAFTMLAFYCLYPRVLRPHARPSAHGALPRLASREYSCVFCLISSVVKWPGVLS
jgi:hypothetical protein